MEEQQVLDEAETPEDPPEDAPAEETPEETPEPHEPGPEHPRFKDVYGKWKHGERELESRNQELANRDMQIQAILEHNQKLTEAVDAIQGTMHEKEMPDPLENPAGYKEWVKEDLKRDLSNNAPPQLPPHQPQQPQQRPPLLVAEQTIAELHDDYYPTVNKVVEEFQSNPRLYQDIMGAPNPAVAAYNYGKKAKQRQQNLGQGYVEGATPAPPTKSVQPTDRDKFISEALGIDVKSYMKQKAFYDKRGY